jgi:hypothetical protein
MEIKMILTLMETVAAMSPEGASCGGHLPLMWKMVGTRLEDGNCSGLLARSWT